MEKNFIRHGFHKRILHEQINKAITTPREITLQKNFQGKNKKNPPRNNIQLYTSSNRYDFKRKMGYLTHKPQIQALFPEPLIVAFR